jgi:ABC-2 type transport system permease protein
MKMIFKIAKTELRNLFYSPVAWFLTVAFMVQCAVYYCTPLVGTARWQDIALKSMRNFKGWGGLTPQLFMAGDSIFKNALQNLYLFIPLLTMGLISREVNNGTIKLLYSSPVKTREIVLGKYLAIMLYNLLLVSVIGVFIVMGIFQIEHADDGMLLSALLGFYLLVCTYTAIGLFMSSLTNYQIVAAIGSFIVILVLSRIGGLWQKYDFVRDINYFLSISGLTMKMLKGLITTKDVIYFGLVIFMFISFTLIKLKSGRESKSWMIGAARYGVVTVVVLAMGYFSSRPAFIGYWDTTAGKYNTLHPNIQKVIEELGDGKLEVTLYTNLLGGGAPKGFPLNRNEYLSEVWERYQRFKPDIEFNYVYYYDTGDKDSTVYKTMPGKSLPEIAEQVASGFDQPLSLFKSPAEIRKMIDLSSESYRVVMELKYKGQRTFLRTFDDNLFWPEDEQIAAALKRLLQAKLPKITFLTGNLERDIYKKGEREYELLVHAKSDRQSLMNLGFDSDTISAGKEIPTDISMLVLADPKTTLDQSTRDRITEYINKGGNMMVLSEPGKQHILNPVLQQAGIQLQDGILVEVTGYEMPDMVKPLMTARMGEMARDGVSKMFYEKMVEGDTLFTVDMSGAVSIVATDTSGFKSKPLFITRPGKDWLKKGALVTDSAAPVFNPLEGDTKAPFYATVMASSRMLRGKEQRIIVCGDADFLSTVRQRGTLTFVSREMFCWLNYEAFPIYGPQVQPNDALLRLTLTGANTVYILFVWILPALVALMGTILLIRRKRQ